MAGLFPAKLKWDSVVQSFLIKQIIFVSVNVGMLCFEAPQFYFLMPLRRLSLQKSCGVFWTGMVLFMILSVPIKTKKGHIENQFSPCRSWAIL